MFAPAYKTVPYRNTERSMKPKLVVDNDNDVVVKTYYPRERVAPRGPTWREQAEKAWAAKQERERRRVEAIDRAIRDAKKASDARAAETYKTITVIPIDKVAVRDIIERVAAKHGFTAEQILGHRRSIPIVVARQEAMCEAARLRPDLSLPQLGRAFHRDHTSILSCLRKHGIR